MSTHYTSAAPTVLLHATRLSGEQQSIDVVLEELAKTQPKLAARLRNIDWKPIVRTICEEALQQAATELGCDVDHTFTVAQGWEEVGRPDGELIGVLRDTKGTKAQLGLVLRDTFPAVFHADRRTGESLERLKEFQSTIARVYRERATIAALRLIGGDRVERRQTTEGTVILEVNVKEVR